MEGGGEWTDDTIHYRLICPECKEDPPNLVEEYQDGDYVCASCGLVVGGRIIDERSEYRTFANDDQANEDPTRVGDAINPLLDGSQLETSIGAADTKAARDLNRAQNRNNESKTTRGLMQAYKKIGNFYDSISVGKSVADTAKHLFKTVNDAKIMKSKPQEAVIAGCIFIACRQYNVGRTFCEIY